MGDTRPAHRVLRRAWSVGVPSLLLATAVVGWVLIGSDRPVGLVPATFGTSQLFVLGGTAALERRHARGRSTPWWWHSSQRSFSIDGQARRAWIALAAYVGVTVGLVVVSLVLAAHDFP